MLSSPGFQSEDEDEHESSVLAPCFSSPSVEQTSPSSSISSQNRNTEDSSPIFAMRFSDFENSSLTFTMNNGKTANATRFLLLTKFESC